MISAVAALTDSVLRSVYRASVEPYEAFSLVVSKQSGIPSDIVATLTSSDTVGRTVAVLDSRVRVKGLFGSESRKILAVPAGSMAFCLGRTGLSVKEGRLPHAGESGVAIHEQIARARGVRVGGYIGREVDPMDYLWGMFQVTGILVGDVPIGIASLEYFKTQWAFDTRGLEYAYLAFPKPGHLERMNTFLAGLPSRQVLLRTLDSAEADFKSESENMGLILWVVNLVVVSIVSFAMGLVNTIHFLGRLREYGLLAALGLTRVQLAARAFSEVVILSGIGFALGLAAAQGVMWYISRSVFQPRGIEISALGPRSLSLSVPIPLLLSLFSLATIGWSLLRLDSISVIEGRE